LTQNLILANETTKLDDVQVVTSASGYEQNVADAPATISVITAEELENNPLLDIAGHPCSKNSLSPLNGMGCAGYAIENVCPDDATKTYWECLP
jgi:hypothetical protein